MNRRLVRLYNDFKEIIELFSDHPYINIESFQGDPPESYLIEYQIKGVVRSDSALTIRDSHLCEIILTSEYPRFEPICRMLSQVVYHPNFSPAKICIADHWAAGESLSSVIIRIGEMICYQNYNTKSPLNPDAAVWAQANIKSFPLDSVSLEPVRKDSSIESYNNVPEILNVSKEHQVMEEKDDILSCENCGAQVASEQMVICSGGHTVCPDCIIECHSCKKTLCVLCEFIKTDDKDVIFCVDCKQNELKADNICPNCRHTIKDKRARFCEMCGSKL